jgi:hypothetical protein
MHLDEKSASFLVRGISPGAEVVANTERRFRAAVNPLFRHLQAAKYRPARHGILVVDCC